MKNTLKEWNVCLGASGAQNINTERLKLISLVYLYKMISCFHTYLVAITIIVDKGSDNMTTVLI